MVGDRYRAKERINSKKKNRKWKINVNVNDVKSEYFDLKEF